MYQNHLLLTRNTLYGIMLLGVFLSAFGAGNLSHAYAQEVVTETLVSTSTPAVLKIPTAEEALKQALIKYIQQVSPRLDYRIVEMHTGKTFAYAIAKPFDLLTNQQILEEVDVLLLAKRESSDTWLGVAPEIVSDKEFNDLLLSFPNDFFDENTKTFLVLTGESNNKSVLNFSGYKLPWQYQQPSPLTAKGNCYYYNGNVYCDNTGHDQQLDFAVQGFSIAGDIYATKPGTVVFVKESSNSGGCGLSYWQKANMVVIQHSTSEYSWYVHLAYNSVPVIAGQQVGYGTKIGVEGATGYSCGTHLHFMTSTGHYAWTDPNNPNIAPWATGITAVDFLEASWDGLTVGNSYISQNGGGGSLNPPTLITPSEGQTLTSRSVHFTWQSPNATNQSGYTFRLSTNSNPDTQPWLVDMGLGNNYSSYDYNFNADGTYYWHMRTWNTSNQASSWVTRSFVINTSGGGGNNPPAGFTWCADEDGHCNFSGKADVVYGAVNSFTSPRSFMDGTDCNNNIFGDPISGTRKACYYKLTDQPPTVNLHVEYFNDKALGSHCYDGYENSAYVFKNWGTGSPASGCNSDNFSARFTGTYNFPGGNYSFHCQHDDGCRIFIGGELKLDAWWDSSFTGHDWGGPLSSGDHEVKIEFYDSSGDARLEAFWSGAGFLPSGPDCTPGEWCGQYFGNKDLAGTPAVQRNEGNTNINYDWGNGSIGYGFPVDNFSARWQRNVYFAAGSYRFHIRINDGGRLWVNNNLVIDQWKDQGATEYIVDLNLSAGEIPLKFEYYENSGGAIAQMGWDALQIYMPPSAGFDTWPQSGFAPLTTALHIIDMSNITSCSWDYGDGQTSTTCAQLHNHVYNNPGSYTVSLTVSGPGGSDGMTRTGYITVSTERYKIYLPLVIR